MPFVAAPGLRVVRRRKGTALVASAAPRALTAASMPVNNPADVFKTNMGGRRDNWQDECWQMYRCVGELGYYVRWRANSCSRVRLVASELDPDTGLPTGGIDPKNAEAQRVAEMVRGIAGGPLGQAQLVKRSAEVLTVPGEHWIAILIRPDAGWADGSNLDERWFVLTPKQIEKGTRRNSVLIKLPDRSKHEFDQNRGDCLIRVWNHDAEDPSEADSPVRACLDPLREIVRTSRKIADADDSRLMNNGMLFVPSEASLPDPQAPTAAGQPGTPVAQPPRKVAASLQQAIINVSKEGMKDQRGAASKVPIVVAAPGDHLSKIHHLEFGKDSTEVDLKKRNEAIGRLAMGLDMTPERLLGMGANSNHWSAYLLADEDVQLHVSPVMETFCQAIYDSVLRNMLEAENIDPAKYVLWYDASALTADPDLTDEAKDAHEKGAITSAALVRRYGLPDDDMYDFDTIEGWQEWARDRVSQDPTLIRALLPLLDSSVQALDFPEPTPALPAGQDGDDDPDDNPEEPATEGDDDRGDGQHAGRAGTELADLAVDFLVVRTLDLAGKRRRTRADMDRLRHVPMHLTHRFMGPVPDAEVARLIKGWDDIFTDEFAAAHGLDPERVRAAVKRIARRELTSQVVDGQVV